MLCYVEIMQAIIVLLRSASCEDWANSVVLMFLGLRFLWVRQQALLVTSVVVTTPTLPVWIFHRMIEFSCLYGRIRFWYASNFNFHVMLSCKELTHGVKTLKPPWICHCFIQGQSRLKWEFIAKRKRGLCFDLAFICQFFLATAAQLGVSTWNSEGWLVICCWGFWFFGDSLK